MDFSRPIEQLELLPGPVLDDELGDVELLEDCVLDVELWENEVDPLLCSVLVDPLLSSELVDPLWSELVDVSVESELVLVSELSDDVESEVRLDSDSPLVDPLRNPDCEASELPLWCSPVPGPVPLPLVVVASP